jgi:hypothetical protein
MFKNEPSCLARQNKNFQSETQGKRQRFIQEIKQKEQMCFIGMAQDEARDNTHSDMGGGTQKGAH